MKANYFNELDQRRRAALSLCFSRQMLGGRSERHAADALRDFWLAHPLLTLAPTSLVYSDAGHFVVGFLASPDEMHAAAAELAVSCAYEQATVVFSDGRFWRASLERLCELRRDVDALISAGLWTGPALPPATAERPDECGTERQG